MSALYVRDTFRKWLNDPAHVVAFYDTVNLDQNPADDVWCTASFDAFARESLTFCPGADREEGEIEVVYFGRPGIGDAELLQAVEAHVGIMEGFTDSTGTFEISSISAPEEFSNGDADREYAVSVIFEYYFYYADLDPVLGPVNFINVLDGPLLGPTTFINV